MPTTPSPSSARRPLPDTIRAVVSDIDGTLVRPDKSLSPATIDAVQTLTRAGVPFSLASARPPKGLRGFIDTLQLQAPLAAYNGGNIVTPDMRVLSSLPLPPDAARAVLSALLDRHIDPWVFIRGEWYIHRMDGDYVDHELATIGYPPVLIKQFDETTIDFEAIDKIVGPSKRTDDLAQLDRDLQTRFAGQLTIGLSQKYYLDITHPEADKGHAVREIALALGVPTSAIAVLGDMSNDVAMFREAGMAIAMGQASDEVKAEADLVTLSNAEDGVANAIHQWILPRIEKVK